MLTLWNSFEAEKYNQTRLIPRIHISRSNDIIQLLKITKINWEKLVLLANHFPIICKLRVMKE